MASPQLLRHRSWLPCTLQRSSGRAIHVTGMRPRACRGLECQPYWRHEGRKGQALLENAARGGAPCWSMMACFSSSFCCPG